MAHADKTPPEQAVLDCPASLDAPAGNPGDRRTLFAWFLFILLFFSLYLVYRLAQPFLHTIILSCVFSAITHPLYARFLKLTKGRDMVAALMVLLCILLLVVLPLTVFTIGLIPQAARSINAVTTWLAGGHIDEIIQEYISPAMQWLNNQVPFAQISAEDLRANLLSFSRQSGQVLLGLSTDLVRNAFSLFAHFLLMLLIMFFLLREGEGMVQALKSLAPMRREQGESILHSLRRMARSVLVGGILVAILQGILGGIGLALVGIPGMFWGTVMVFAALVPVVGTGLVWAPAVAYLFIIGYWKSAVFLLIWCGLGVTSVDSFLRPIIMRGSSKISLLFLFMSILGGINAFGMLGLLYGPLILSFSMVMLGIYGTEFHEDLNGNKS